MEKADRQENRLLACLGKTFTSFSPYPRLFLPRHMRQHCTETPENVFSANPFPSRNASIVYLNSKPTQFAALTHHLLCELFIASFFSEL